MSKVLDPPEFVAGPLQDARWALVQRVAASRQLGKASQLREILLYISRRTLMENANSISEQEIGCRVLGRRPDFNPNEDNIVRAQMRHLRQKLEDYFASDGAGEPLVLTIPRGSYLPHFEDRPAPLTTESAVKRRGHRRTTILLWVVLACLIAAGLVLWRRQEAHPPGSADAALRTDPLWARIFAPGRETSIVISDSCMVVLQDILDVDVPLSEYLRGGYPEKLIEPVPDPKLHAALKLIAARQYTSLGDATIAARLMEVSHRYAAHTNIRYARDVSVREFKTGNFVLIGSRRGVPWVQLFEPKLNFYLAEDRQTRKYFLGNRAPAPGEPTAYGRVKAGQTSPETFADIALLPNLAGTGNVLTLSGVDMAATEAAGDLVARPDFSSALARLLGSRPGQPPPAGIEILLQAKAMGGTAGDSKIVAYRLLK